MRRHFRDGAKDTDLEGTTRTTAGQNQRRFDIIRMNFHGFGVL